MNGPKTDDSQRVFAAGAGALSRASAVLSVLNAAPLGVLVSGFAGVYALLEMAYPTVRGTTVAEL